MKRYGKKTETHTYDILLNRTCDLCGKVSKGGETEWIAATYDSNETEITVKVKQREGANYPEGGSGTEYDIDICPTCFKGKLIPWFISQGANVRQEDWSW